jgi:dTDP-glucose pyrophosphorylase
LKDFDNILLKYNDTLKDTIKKLHSGGRRIILVVDDRKKLLGTVTDGDIRRALIKHTSMDCAVGEIMNCSPFTARISDTYDVIMGKMKSLDLLAIPLVDQQGMLIGLETLRDLFEIKKHDNPVFLMAGGFGKRLHPLTVEKPKPMLNVGSRPILETIIRRFIDAGFHIFYISIHYKASMIRDYFGDGSSWGVKIEYLYEESPLGTAGSLGLLPDDMPKLPIVVMNGDLLTKVNFEHLLDFHCKYDGLATMCIREYDFKVPYGVVDIEDQYVTSIEEKPVQRFFINAGIYVIDPKITEQVDGSTHLDMTSLLKNQIDQGRCINTFPIHEYWLDIGRMEEYKQAHEYFSKESFEF